MRFGFWTYNRRDWADTADRCHQAVAAGWDGLWYADHFMPLSGDPSDPVPECWTVLSALAATTQGVRVGSLVSGNTYRNPALLLKQASTVDQIAGGRVVLGVGAGWQQNEHEAYGFHYGTVRERLDRFEEACELMVRLRDEPDGVSFEGRYYQLADAPLSPRPPGPLPLMIGGGGERRTLRIAARFADEWNVWGAPDVLRHKQSVLDAHCADVGRDPSQIRRSAAAVLVLGDEGPYLDSARQADFRLPALVGTPAEVAEMVSDYVAAGVDELILADFNPIGFDVPTEVYDRFQAEVAAQFR